MTAAAVTKAEVLELAEQYLCPDRVRTMRTAGIAMVIGRREGYRLWDLDGTERIDLHLNGGVYNLGHRNPDVIATLLEAVQTYDIGNHHFPSGPRAVLARRLVEATPGMRYAVFASGGGEAVDLAIKSARRATGRRVIISLTDAYHGHTGLALTAGDERAAAAFLSDDPNDVIRVPFDDLAALEHALIAHDVAAVLVETIPATAGFPVPSTGYLPGLRRLCDAHGAAYIADEVQTGLGRTGSLWGTQHFGVVPDILVTGKGLSGGIYPIAATLLSEPMGAWLEQDGWGHISTFGGSELGCQVAGTVLDLTLAPATVERAAAVARRWARGLAELARRYPGWIAEVRQTGLVIGLRMHQEMGGMLMTKLLFDEGVWAMFAGFDRSVLQVKPGLLMDDATIDEALAAFDRACATAASW
ncbi:MAG: hypothetical protein QG597_1727 [Actinomycetota bacterium]|nr:hypothetical protein [Actinomycetota bacterium]